MSADLVHPIALGPLHLAGNLVLAPMHEHTHLALRVLARRAGAALAHTEMVAPEDLLAPADAGAVPPPADARAAGPLSAKAANILASGPQDRPLGVQLLPRDPAPLADAVAMLAARRVADLVDLNFACPSRRVVQTGRGGAMLRRPDDAARLVATAAGASALPVTVKMRLGFTAGEADRRRALALAREALAAGAVAVTLHARAVVQGYGGRAEWGAIARWAEALAPAPVLGSGDLRGPEAVLAMLRETGCAGASIARGALGAPWIFRQALALAATGTYEQVSMQERGGTLLAHFEGLKRQYGEARAVTHMRRLGQYYARGIPRAAQARAALQAVRAEADLRRAVTAWFEPRA